MTGQLNSPILMKLHEEHVATLDLLERLEALLRRCGPSSPPEADDETGQSLVAELITMLDDEITHHYAFEEAHLFPRFGEYFDLGIPMMLKSEHDAIRPLAAKAAELGKAGQEAGFTPESWAEFHGLAREIIEREVFHVQKEEMGFLPTLAQVMDPAMEEALAEAYEKLKEV